MAKASKILLAHGSGGRLSHDLVAKEFVPPWQNPILDQLNDSAVFSLSADGSGPRLAFTTDSYVVKPLSFKGGDIGRLAGGGPADGLFVNTAGVGRVPAGLEIGGDRARVGDAVILSGSIGDHGIAVLSQREGLEFEAAVESDVAPLNGLVAVMLAASPNVRVLRDPTRGGLATSLNEIAAQPNVGRATKERPI